MKNPVLILILCAAIVRGADWYVETGATGSSCTSADPCATLGEALLASNAGDTIRLGPGFHSITGSSYDSLLTDRSFIGAGVDTSSMGIRPISLRSGHAIRDVSIEVTNDGGFPSWSGVYAEGDTTLENVELNTNDGICIQGSWSATGTVTLSNVVCEGAGLTFSNYDGPESRLDVVIDDLEVLGGNIVLRGDGVHARLSNVNVRSGVNGPCLTSEAASLDLAGGSFRYCASSGKGGGIYLGRPYYNARGHSTQSFDSDIKISGEIVIENCSADRGGAMAIEYNYGGQVPEGDFMTVDSRAAFFTLSDNSASNGGQDLSIEGALSHFDLSRLSFPVAVADAYLEPESLADELCDPEFCACFDGVCSAVGICDSELMYDDGSECDVDQSCKYGKCEEGVCIVKTDWSYDCASTAWNTAGTLAIVGAAVGVMTVVNRQKAELARMTPEERAAHDAKKLAEAQARGPPGLFGCFRSLMPTIVFFSSFLMLPMIIVMSWLRARGNGSTAALNILGSLLCPLACCYPCWYNDERRVAGLGGSLPGACVTMCCCGPCAVSRLVGLREYEATTKATIAASGNEPKGDGSIALPDEAQTPSGIEMEELAATSDKNELLADDET